jgi:formamidopyrimidine-DNA glycosylase
VPELPDVQVYVERLRERFVGHTLTGVRTASPFLLRSVDPPLAAFAGARLVDVRRMGKRIVLCLQRDGQRDGDEELFLVVHLMIAGRFKLADAGAKVPGRVGLCAFDFDDGTLILTEQGTKKRASLHAVRGEAALALHDPGGLEVLDADVSAFAAALASERHTLKRALTDPRLFSGIGNAYSDEILHRARLSPMKLTTSLDEAGVQRLYDATRAVLNEWLERLRAEGRPFPAKVTAFRPEMAVHGRYRQPCPVCGTPIQRVVYAENEMNYCARCQTEDRLLADRALSRLLKSDWPRTLDELEGLRRGHKSAH